MSPAKLPKPLAFALIGALGCLVGAVAGEGLLLATYRPPPLPPPPTPPQSICILIDCSGSMNGSPLREVKDAARRFVSQVDLTRDQVAVVGFGGQVHPAAGLNATRPELEQAVEGLADGGSTRMDLGIAEARTQLASRKGEPVILLFTDGVPDDRERALAEARLAGAGGAKIVAIAAGSADSGFLAQVTGDPSRVIATSSGGFGLAFDQAGESIFGRQLLQSGKSGAYTYREALWRVAGWTAALALLLVLALASYQTFLLRQRLPPPARLAVLTAAGIGSGLVAGMSGQLLFSVLAIFGPLEAVGRVVGWGVLGALIGRAMALVIPNLKPRQSWAGGAVGGVLGGVGFLTASSLLGDLGGRFLGAVLIGACVGLLVSLVEVLFREAWLTVAFGPVEQRTVSLGAEPVTIGSGPNCTVYAGDTPAVAASISFAAGRLSYRDESGVERAVTPGSWIKLGKVALAVNTPEVRADLNELPRLFLPPADTFIYPTSAPPPSPPPSPPPTALVAPLQLRLRSGNSVSLVPGKFLFGSDLGDASRSAMTLAQVQPHPTDAGVSGLQNLSTATWTVSDGTGKAIRIAPRGTVTLKAGLRIDLGFTTVEVVSGGG